MGYIIIYSYPSPGPLTKSATIYPFSRWHRILSNGTEMTFHLMVMVYMQYDNE